MSTYIKKQNTIKGYIKERGNAVTYNLLWRGKIVYIGVTNNPRERLIEHKEEGKVFDKMIITSKSIKRQMADYKEMKDLAEFRSKHGRNPEYNKTWDGKWH